MTSFSTKQYTPTEGLLVRVVDNGTVLTLDYQEATAQHQRSLWWGTAVGYRAMQMAALALSKETLWSRDNLTVVSGHPGPGVLDSLNFVTLCRERDTLTVLENPNCVSRCNSEMKFEWWVSDGEQCAHVILREDFVSRDFYELIDRRVYNEHTKEDDKLFELYKVNMSSQIWVDPLEKNFSVKYETPLAKGELPKGSDWSLDLEVKAEASA